MAAGDGGVIVFNVRTKANKRAECFIAHAEQKYEGRNKYIPLLYKIAVNTGMRWGEIIALKWDCVYLSPDIAGSMITVKRSYCNVSGQLRETTKGHKIRYSGVNEVLYDALKEAYRERDPKNDLVSICSQEHALK